MTERLDVSFTPLEGSLLRMLGLVERRGFIVRNVTMRETKAGASLAMDIEPRVAGRDLDVVARQLERLVDVVSVQISVAPEGQSA